MSSWDTPGFSNGFILEGEFMANHKNGTNKILAFTFSPGTSWLSVDSPNLQALTSDSDTRGKRKLDLMVSVDATNPLGLVREMRVQKEMRKEKPSHPRRSDVFYIYIFTSPSSPNADKKIKLHNIGFKPDRPGTMPIRVPFTKRTVGVPLPNIIYTLTYSDLEVV